MATIKVFALGGLDKKSNDLTRSPEKASDMLNMEYDVQSSLKKRNGFELFKNISCDDFIYYSFTDEFLLFTNNSSSVVILKKDGTTKTISLPDGIGSLSSVSISSTENQSNIYFTNTDQVSYVMKYDGSNIYRAGLPTPRKTSDAAVTITNPTSGYTRFFYSFKDINGNITYSPYYQLAQAITGSSVISINSLKYDSTCKQNGFLYKYAWYNQGSDTVLTKTNRTILSYAHNYVSGDLFLFDTEAYSPTSSQNLSITPSDRVFLALEVESVVSNVSITFKASSFTIGGVDYSITVPSVSAGQYPLDTRSKIHIFQSTSADTNYIELAKIILPPNTLTNTTAFGLLYQFNIGNTYKPLEFEDVYDSTTFKLLPPICKYISSCNDQIIYASVSSFFDNSNNVIRYLNENIISYSDSLTGTNGNGPEGVSPLNIEKVGETEDGVITGTRRCNDSILIFKTRGVFSIDGTLTPTEFQLRKINTNFVGCTSHKSILESDDGLYFQGYNGIYFTNAIGVKKLTYEIDSVVNSADYNTTRSVRLKKKQKALFYVPQLSKIIVLDYYYNQIYFWDSINASKGFVEDSSGDVYFSNGTNIYKFNNGYLDDTQPINAYYSTTWHHAGEPSLNKKWLSMRVFALTDDTFTATIKTEGNWDTAQLTTNTMQFSSSDQTKFLMLDMQTKRSLRITFSNNVKKETSPGSNIFIGENLAITGYELTFEKFNDVDKN